MVRRAAPHLKILALLSFVLAVVAVPASLWPLFALVLVVLSRVPLRFLLPRMVVEVPFLVFALVIPFVATGPRVDLGWFPVSEPGLVAAGLLVAKGSLGVLASLTLAATTEPQEPLRGLERLRLSALLVQILGFTRSATSTWSPPTRSACAAGWSPAASTPATRGTGRCWHAPSAPCSSAPTSAASACTSRWCREGFRPAGRWPR